MKVNFASFFIQSICYIILPLTINLVAFFNLQSQSIYRNYLLSDTSNVGLLYDNMINSFDKSIFHKPFINKIELRTESKEFRLDQQEYSLRLSTSNPFNNKYQNKINTLEKQQLLLTKLIKNSESLYLKYNQIIKLEYAKRKLELIKEEVSLFEKILQFQKSQLLQTGKENISKFYELYVKLNNAEVDLSNSELEFQQLYSEIFGNNIQILNRQLLSISEIEQYINQYHMDANLADEKMLEYELVKSKFELEQKISNENLLLDHIQLKYLSDPDDMIRDNISIGFGFRIPGLVSKSYLHDNYRYKTLKSNLEKAEIQERYTYKINNLKNKIQKISHSYNLISEQNNKIRRTYNIDSLLKKGLNDPELILEFKLQFNKQNKLLNNLNEEAAKYFIDFLFLSNHFVKNPRRYYLALPFSEL